MKKISVVLALLLVVAFSSAQEKAKQDTSITFTNDALRAELKRLLDAGEKLDAEYFMLRGKIDGKVEMIQTMLTKMDSTSTKPRKKK